MQPGRLITFEGIDGCGKTTQVKMLFESLQQLGIKVHITKEPGDDKAGSVIGSGVRDILFRKPGTHNLGTGVSDLLFLADHLQNTYDIKELLKEGKIILCDRYADSQFAYVSSPTRNAADWSYGLYQEHYGPVPDLTLLFVVRGEDREDGREDISWALQRANSRKDGKQDGKAWNAVEEQRTIQKTYITNLTPLSRTRVIDVWEHMSLEDVHEKVRFAFLNSMYTKE